MRAPGSFEVLQHEKAVRRGGRRSRQRRSTSTCSAPKMHEHHPRADGDRVPPPLLQQLHREVAALKLAARRSALSVQRRSVATRRRRLRRRRELRAADRQLFYPDLDAFEEEEEQIMVETNATHTLAHQEKMGVEWQAADGPHARRARARASPPSAGGERARAARPGRERARGAGCARGRGRRGGEEEGEGDSRRRGGASEGEERESRGGRRRGRGGDLLEEGEEIEEEEGEGEDGGATPAAKRSRGREDAAEPAAARARKARPPGAGVRILLRRSRAIPLEARVAPLPKAVRHRVGRFDGSRQVRRSPHQPARAQARRPKAGPWERFVLSVQKPGASRRTTPLPAETTLRAASSTRTNRGEPRSSSSSASGSCGVRGTGASPAPSPKLCADKNRSSRARTRRRSSPNMTWSSTALATARASHLRPPRCRPLCGGLPLQKPRELHIPALVDRRPSPTSGPVRAAALASAALPSRGARTPKSAMRGVRLVVDQDRSSRLMSRW